MNYRILSLAIISFLLCIACARNKKMTYEFPEKMPENVKQEFLRQCEKGEALYEISCAKCHTQKTLFSKKITDFTSAQLYGYEMRRSNSTHEKTLTTETVTTEELGYIISFLQYKRRSGLTHKSTHQEDLK